ncbi:hypothetical protein ACI8AA_12180 [Geodermatophilus sp. SYSU D01180]
MTTRVLYAGISALLLLVALTVVAVVLAVPGEHRSPGTDLAFCQPGEAREDCYPVEA